MESCHDDDVTIDISSYLHRAFPKMIPIDVVLQWHNLLSSLPFYPYVGMSCRDDNASARLSSPFPSRLTSISCFVVVLPLQQYLPLSTTAVPWLHSSPPRPSCAYQRKGIFSIDCIFLRAGGVIPVPIPLRSQENIYPRAHGEYLSSSSPLGKNLRLRAQYKTVPTAIPVCGSKLTLLLV